MTCSSSARGRALGRALLVALGLLALTCQGEPVRDAGRIDADGPVDAAPDEDSGADADAVRDAGDPTDGGSPVDPEWTPVAGTEGCIEAARNPEAVLAELPMRSCGAGCREVDVNWTGPREGDLFRVEDVVPDPSGGAMLVFLRRVDSVWQEALVAASDARILAAYRTPWDAPLCLGGPVAITPTRVVLTILRGTTEGDLAPPILLTADLATPRGVRIVHTFESAPFVQYLDASESVVAVGGVGTTARVTYDGAVEWMTGSFDALHGDAVFVTRQVGRREIAVRDANGERVLISADGADAATLMTDGRDMAWYVGSPIGDRWDASEIQTSPFTVDPPVSGRRVADSPYSTAAPAFVVSNGHLILTTREVGGLTIYALEDGSEVDRIPPDGDGAFAIATYAYITDSELGFSVTRTNILPWATTYRWVER